MGFANFGPVTIDRGIPAFAVQVLRNYLVLRRTINQMLPPVSLLLPELDQLFVKLRFQITPQTQNVQS